MNVDWSHLIWQGRWQGLVIVWHSIVTDVQTIWWFWPLLVGLLLMTGRKGLLRLAAYVARVFIHTHLPS